MRIEAVSLGDRHERERTTSVNGMAKPLLMLCGLAVVAGAGYFYRDALTTYWTGQSNAATSGPNEAKPASPAKPPAAAAKKGGGGAAPVTTALAEIADMPIILSAPGTVEAAATVAIKPRVDGQVVAVGFNEGDLVQAGSVLYRLDERLVRAQIAQAEAQINRDQASLKDAMQILDRKESLLVKKYASEATTETARQQVEVLRASIAASQALLEIQRTQLDYLTIRAPITGRTGSITARLGSFVRSAEPVALVVINQTKPITVSFALPQTNLLALKNALATKSEASISVSGSIPVKVKGRLIFVDNQVDKTTGTVTAKVTAENADETLWPGLAVGVDLLVETRKGLIAVPASAVIPAQTGMITWVVGANNTVSVRNVKVDRVIGQTTYLSEGLKVGERIVTDGQLRLSQGAAVAIRDGRPTGGPGAGTGSGPADAAGKAKRDPGAELNKSEPKAGGRS